MEQTLSIYFGIFAYLDNTRIGICDCKHILYVAETQSYIYYKRSFADNDYTLVFNEEIKINTEKTFKFSRCFHICRF